MFDIEKLIKEAKKNTEVAQRKQKLYYDLKRRGVAYKVGDEVLKIKHSLSSAPEDKTAKFFSRFEGPYVIEKITHAVVVLKARNGETCSANIDQIKPYYDRNKMKIFQIFCRIRYGKHRRYTFQRWENDKYKGKLMRDRSK